MTVIVTSLVNYAQSITIEGFNELELGPYKTMEFDEVFAALTTLQNERKISLSEYIDNHKLDGNETLLRVYLGETDPLTMVIPDNVEIVVFLESSIDNLTITLPANPRDKQKLTLSFCASVNDVAYTAGPNIIQPITNGSSGTARTFMWLARDATWIPLS
jgi:hypothetical protein